MRIKRGSRVSTEAWRFDRKHQDIKDRWSYSQFGEAYLDSRCFGSVERKEGEKWVIHWDIDGSLMAFESTFLQLESNTAPKQVYTLLLDEKACDSCSSQSF